MKFQLERIFIIALVSFGIFVGCALAKEGLSPVKDALPPVAVYHNDGDCDFEGGDTTLIKNTRKGIHLTSVRGFLLKYKWIAGDLDVFILNDYHLHLLESGKSFKKSFSIDHTCDSTYFQFQFLDTYHVIAKCGSEGDCKAKLAMSDNDCTHISDDNECGETGFYCGWCEHMNSSTESYCVPGKSFKPDYGIKCDDYFNFFGSALVISIFTAICCCCCICGSICYITQEKLKQKDKVEKKKLLLSQEGALLSSQSESINMDSMQDIEAPFSDLGEVLI
eukprot:TRINITY_DN1227_c0_g1_i1.p1 TRINITY_DN1227_c0_g1~~TRINITY_DN1227_c0_g1_i1.p1  ORF type:complete len:278 (+),score=44.38 TRINITY_DN1227_c0_g1_i1:51-884(+)